MRAPALDGVLGADRAAAVAFAGGAALLSQPASPSASAPVAAVLLADELGHGLGAALAWAAHHDVASLHVVAADQAGLVARRAALFEPAPTVWQVVDRRLEPAEPKAPTSAGRPDSQILDLVPLLTEAGVDIVVEHGRVTGEVLGLEVAQVVVDSSGARLEVGVGRHDREAFAMLHGELPTAEALRSVVDSVRLHRGSGGMANHPLARMAPQRWLRAAVVARPELVGAAHLEAVEPAVARTGVKDRSPAIALGTDTDGRPVVVACSTGVDLELVPAAADARQLHAPEARLVLAVPERDAHPVTARLAGALRSPAEVVAVAGDWRRTL